MKNADADYAYNEVNKAWKSTCKVILGEEIGNLSEYESYLCRYIDPTTAMKSALTACEVVVSSNKFCNGARFISYNEMEIYAKKTANVKIDINKIKDLDSILTSMQELFYYTGNIVLGSSSNVVKCHRCINTNYAYFCQDVYDGKFSAFTTSIRNPEYAFGCCFGGDVKFCIKILDPYKTTRCMELFHCNVATDCYYSASLEDSTDCMFSFNQRNKRNMIGNISLQKDKYNELKKKLVSEIAEDFARKKSVPSIIDIISG